MDYIISIIPQMLMGTVDTLRLFFITLTKSGTAVGSKEEM